MSTVDKLPTDFSAVRVKNHIITVNVHQIFELGVMLRMNNQINIFPNFQIGGKFIADIFRKNVVDFMSVQNAKHVENVFGVMEHRISSCCHLR